jgi:uncharacterized DUF497 family protein
VNYNFEWDSRKAKTNLQKHKVSFEVATTIFHDPRAISVYDHEHSMNEDRWVTIGIDKNGNLIVLNHTYQEIDIKNVIIRIISARKATKEEIKQYKELK